MSEPGRPMTFVTGAAWTIAASLLGDIAIQATESARPGAMGDLVNVTACQVLAYSVVIFAMLRVHAPDIPVRDVVAFRPAPLLILVMAATIGACMYPALSVADAFVAKRFPAEPEALELAGKLLLADTKARRVVLVGALLVVLPIAEEIFFRGVLFGRLRKDRSAGVVILATAAFYVAAHPDERGIVSVIALGVVLGWLRERSGGIIATVTAQTAFFAVPVVPILRGTDPMADEIFPRGWVLGGLGLALGAAAVVEMWTRHRKAADVVEPK